MAYSELTAKLLRENEELRRQLATTAGSPTPSEAAVAIFDYLEKRRWGRGEQIVQEADIAAIIAGTFSESVNQGLGGNIL